MKKGVGSFILAQYELWLRVVQDLNTVKEKEVERTQKRSDVIVNLGRGYSVPCKLRVYGKHAVSSGTAEVRLVSLNTPTMKPSGNVQSAFCSSQVLQH